MKLVQNQLMHMVTVPVMHGSLAHDAVYVLKCILVQLVK